MDNLFQLIIFLVIIYSVFNMFFGKKKTQGTGSGIPGKTNGEDSKKSSPVPANILEEMLGYKIPKTENEYEMPKQKEIPVPVIPKEVTPTSEVEVAEESSPVLMKDNHNSINERAQVQIMINMSSQRTLALKNKIRNPSSLKEFYLISEILKKPKMMRR